MITQKDFEKYSIFTTQKDCLGHLCKRYDELFKYNKSYSNRHKFYDLLTDYIRHPLNINNMYLRYSDKPLLKKDWELYSDEIKYKEVILPKIRQKLDLVRFTVINIYYSNNTLYDSMYLVPIEDAKFIRFIEDVLVFDINFSINRVYDLLNVENSHILESKRTIERMSNRYPEEESTKFVSSLIHIKHVHKIEE